MYEFDTVSSSSPTDLARHLTQRSSDGWDVVGIVGSGVETTAYLRREARAAAVAPMAATSTPSAVQEPAGWGVSPTAASTGNGATTEPSPASATVSTATAAAASSSVPQVPAGWYADPAGRYELRYWDGAQWTEHVARGGTQYTDPPVA